MGFCPSPRENLITALSRKRPDCVPKEATFTSFICEIFKERTGANNPADYFKFEMRDVEFKPTRLKQDFSGYLPKNLPKETKIDEWGTGKIPHSFYHFTERIFPMANLKTIKEIEEYPFPDITADYRRNHLEKEVRKIHDQGFAVTGGEEMGVFEQAWYLRGFENLLVDFSDNPDFVNVLLDKITESSSFQAKRFAEAGVDVLRLGDDIGTQRAMIMNPKLWRKWLKPRLARIIRGARKIKRDIFIYYHSDGYIEPVISDLIEIGVNVLNPVQPECMSPIKLKKKYGDQLAFWGTIGTQTTMPFETPKGVRKVVKERIKTVGKDGGLVLAPTHVLEPDVPWENIIAFFEAVGKNGKY